MLRFFCPTLVLLTLTTLSPQGPPGGKARDPAPKPAAGAQGLPDGAEGERKTRALANARAAFGEGSFFHQETAHLLVVGKVPGKALRVRADVFEGQVGQDGSLRGVLLRYTHAFLDQLSQWLACNSLHLILQRCCRWLLMTHDRVRTDRFPVTHELLAALLGVQRAGITRAMGQLQAARVLHNVRGQVVILDRPGLEAAACECYGIISQADGTSVR